MSILKILLSTIIIVILVSIYGFGILILAHCLNNITKTF